MLGGLVTTKNSRPDGIYHLTRKFLCVRLYCLSEFERHASYQNIRFFSTTSGAKQIFPAMVFKVITSGALAQIPISRAVEHPKKGPNGRALSGHISAALPGRQTLRLN